MTNNPVILFIHNKYSKEGGEDTVVQNETAILKANGYEVHYKEFSNKTISGSWRGILSAPFNLFFNVAAFISLYRFIKKQKIDVVHVHNFFYTASPSVFWAAKAAGAATVLTIHNYRLFCLNGIFFREGEVCLHCHTHKNFQKGREEKCFRSSTFFSTALSLSTVFHRKIHTWKNKVDRFIVVNAIVPQLLMDIGVPEKKIVFKPNFLIDIPKRPASFDTRNDTYLFVGRLNAEKGVSHLIRAFEKTQKKLLLVGDGELKDFVTEHVSSNIRYAGQQSKEELIQLYQNCRALVFPSLWLEGMPMTIIEAQSEGMVVIAAKSAVTEKMISDGEDGFLYDAGIPGDILRVINIFEALTAVQASEISSNAYRRYIKHYTAAQHLENVSAIYRSVIVQSDKHQ
jgi:glycosyltransferase involved in cell wall biosynthesis